MQNYDHKKEKKNRMEMSDSAVQNASNPIVHTCAKGIGFLLIF